MILALDQSSRVTGWAAGEPSGPVTTGTFRVETKSESIATACDEFVERLVVLVRNLGPDVMVFEQPIQGGGRMNLRTSRKLYTIATDIERVATRIVGCPVYEVRNSEAKKTAYGKCPRNKKPADADKRIQAWGIDARGPDEADAAAVWLEYVRLMHPAEFDQWLKARAA